MVCTREPAPPSLGVELPCRGFIEREAERANEEANVAASITIDDQLTAQSPVGQERRRVIQDDDVDRDARLERRSELSSELEPTRSIDVLVHIDCDVPIGVGPCRASSS